MIVIGCCNKDGGLFTYDGELLKINDQDVRGVAAVHGNIYYVNRTTLFKDGTNLAPAVVAHDLHGLIYFGGSLWATDPVVDLIHEFNIYGLHLGTYRWFGDNKGRWHTNDIWLDDENLWTCSFVGGICKNGQQLELGKHRQPHSVIRHDATLYFCASNVGQVFRDNEVFCEPGGFTRGLHATPDGLLVGSSAERHGAGGTKARMQLYGWDGLLKYTVDVPANEIYAITTTEMGMEHVKP